MIMLEKYIKFRSFLKNYEEGKTMDNIINRYI